MTSSADLRCDPFFNWKPGAPVEGILGAGRYGTVFKTRGGGALKEVVAKGDGNRRQAYREHVMGILQSLLVLSGTCPHFPVHFAARLASENGSLRVRMWMEHFEGSLEAVELPGISEPPTWAQALFQVNAGLLALAELGIAHNDLFPRNVLVRLTEPRVVVYQLHEQIMRAQSNFLLAITDFGIASGRILDCAREPEVARGLRRAHVGEAFGAEPSVKHLLHYKALPPFSRDAYALHRWGAFPQKGALGTAPKPVRLWCASTLEFIDRNREAFGTDAGPRMLATNAFSDETLRSFGIDVSFVPSSEEARSLDAVLNSKQVDDLVGMAEEALRRVQ
jgi:serine/threonine protein kinase